MEHLVSIGMPVYNCSKYIDDAIVSIINQSYTKWELIIVDDFSTDDTLEKINKYCDPRIRLVINEFNKGLPTCLNDCINISKGEYFARMDGDDIMVTERLKMQVEFFNNNTDYDVIGGLAYLIDQDNEVKGYKKSLSPKSVNEIIKLQGYFIHPTVMGKLDWFKKNLYDANINRCQDFELWLRTFEFSNFYIMEEKLLFYREIKTNYKEKYYQVYLNLKQILEKHKKLLSKKQYFTSLSKAYLKYLLFEVFVYFGILQYNQHLSTSELETIKNQLYKAIEI